MTTTLWAKGYTLDSAVAQFQAARNAALDVYLARYDVLGSLAHARTLHRIGILDQHDWHAIHAGLCELLQTAERGELVPSEEEEDIHTTVENRLVQLIGTSAKNLHTGRSRNDQVLVDLRLYAKESLMHIVSALLDTSDALLRRAREHEWTPMPGYTHMQRGMLSSVGLWAAAYAEALLDDLVALNAAYQLNDQSPLGSAAAYGVPLPLDRTYTAQLLGFAGAHHNVLAAGNARGKVEGATVQALALVMLELSKWAQDVLLFTTAEYGFFSVPTELCDGSSIMPQKHNLSALELVRARAHTVISLQGQILSTLAGLPSGYNMDYQETKAALINAFDLSIESLDVVRRFADALVVQRERIEAACGAELFAADRAYALTASGVPFRDAYRQIAGEAPSGPEGQLVEHLRERVSEGAPGNLELDLVAQRISVQRTVWSQRQKELTRAFVALADAVTDAQQIAPEPHGGASGITGEHLDLIPFHGSRAVALGI